LSDSSGNQAVHIAPEAFAVASAEFPDQINFWQDALPGDLKGQLESVCIFFLFDLSPFNLATSSLVQKFLRLMGKIPTSRLMPMLSLLAASRELVPAKIRALCSG